MAPANQPSSKVSAIDARMTPSGSGSVAPAAKKKIAKKKKRTSTMAPANRPRFKMPGVDPRMTSSVWASLTVAQAEKILNKHASVRFTTCANGKIHVDFDPSGNPIGPNGLKFALRVGTVVSRNAPVNVGKWDDIPKEQIQSMIDCALSMFDVDISKPYVKDWILWRMKLRFKCIQDDATKELSGMGAVSVQVMYFENCKMNFIG
ncbi:hypothetical protein Q3G72_003269 [Acer saccharum]|nr:hypothetical protein Q3G72_003269 [Acer saccharum]